MIRLMLSCGNKDVIEAFVKRALPKIDYHLLTLSRQQCVAFFSELTVLEFF